jgi:hypothetical protein
MGYFVEEMLDRRRLAEIDLSGKRALWSDSLSKRRARGHDACFAMAEDGNPMTGPEQTKRSGKTDPGRATADDRNTWDATRTHAA